MSEKRITVGKILSPHGIQGHFKIMSFTQIPQDLALFSPLWIGETQLTKWALFRKTGQSNIFIAACAFISAREDVRRFNGQYIQIYRNQLPETRHELYYVDFEGKEVVDSRGDYVGRVTKVHDFGAGPVLEVQKENQDTLFSIKNIKDLEENPLVLTFCPCDLK